MKAAMGRFFKACGDYAFVRDWDWISNVCYEQARKCGAEVRPPLLNRYR